MHDIDKSIEEAARNLSLEDFPELLSSSKPPYQIGDHVKVRVCNVFPKYALCRTLDKYEFKGLIHISAITGNHIDDIYEYINMGDEFDAAIKNIKEEKSRFGKKYELEFSLVHLGLKPKSSGAFAALLAIKDQLEDRPVQEEPIQEDKMKEDDNKVMIHVERSQPNLIYSKYPRELREALTYIVNLCGMASPETEKRVQKLIEEYGVFHLAMAMSKAAEHFNPDLSAHFLDEVEKRIGDGL